MRNPILIALTFLLLLGPTAVLAAPTPQPADPGGSTFETAELTRKDCREKKDRKARRACFRRLRNQDKPGPLLCFGKAATIRVTGSALVQGTEGDDVIVGDAGPNRVQGNGGIDRICLGGGNDVTDGNEEVALLFASGGPGKDVVRGGEGNDQLFGGDGDDEITDSFGDDRLEGGEGNDTLRDFLSGDSDTLVGGPGFDTCDAAAQDFVGPVAC